jgi:hypothetical protein
MAEFHEVLDRDAAALLDPADVAVWAGAIAGMTREELARRRRAAKTRFECRFTLKRVIKGCCRR